MELAARLAFPNLPTPAAPTLLHLNILSRSEFSNHWPNVCIGSGKLSDMSQHAIQPLDFEATPDVSSVFAGIGFWEFSQQAQESLSHGLGVDASTRLQNHQPRPQWLQSQQGLIGQAHMQMRCALCFPASTQGFWMCLAPPLLGMLGLSFPKQSPPKMPFPRH